MQNKKYQWFQNDENDYHVFHVHQTDPEPLPKRTFIASTDTAEKADFLTQAANTFDIDKADALKALQMAYEVMMQPFQMGDRPEIALQEKDVVAWLRLRRQAEIAFKQVQLSNQIQGKRAIIRDAKKGGFIWVLKTGNNKTFARSFPQIYETKQAAIKTLKEHFPDFEIVDKTESAENEKQ